LEREPTAVQPAPDAHDSRHPSVEFKSESFRTAFKCFLCRRFVHRPDVCRDGSQPMAECPPGDLCSSKPWTPGSTPAANRLQRRSSVLLSIQISGSHASAMIMVSRIRAGRPRVDSRYAAARPRLDRDFRTQTLWINGRWPCRRLHREHPTNLGHRVSRPKPRMRPRSARIRFTAPWLIARTRNRRALGRSRPKRVHRRCGRRGPLRWRRVDPSVLQKPEPKFLMNGA
jgi:hypothetical protein